MGFMDKLNSFAKKAQDKIQEAQAKIQDVATQVSSSVATSTPVAAQNWYYTRDGKKKLGPCSVEKMKDLAKSGTLLPSDMVMQEGTTKWKPASQVQEFFPAFGATSPSPQVTSEPAEWHFMQNGQQAGPVTWKQLKQRGASGQLLATDMVWKNGMAAWAAASTIKDLISTPTIVPSAASLAPPPPPPVPTEPPEWYFTQEGQQTGPETWTQLKQRAAAGQLLASDMVWKSGMASWTAASTINDLIVTPKTAPPPLPPNNQAVSITFLTEPHSPPESQTNGAIAYRERGEQMQKAGKLDEAIANFRKAIHLDPANAAYHTWLAEAYREKGMLDEYVAEYKEAARLDKTFDDRLANANAYCHAFLAKAHLEKGMLDESLVEYTKAARLDKQYVDCVIHLAEKYCGRGIEHYQQGHLQNALDDLERAVQLDPTYAFLDCGDGKLQASIGAFQRSIDNIKNKLAMNAGTATAERSQGYQQVPCPSCNQTGYWNVGFITEELMKCRHCGGKGWLLE